MVVDGGGGGSKRLFSLNPSTVMVVLLLGLWLLLGCDNKQIRSCCVCYFKIWPGTVKISLYRQI